MAEVLSPICMMTVKACELAAATLKGWLKPKENHGIDAISGDARPESFKADALMLLQEL